MYILLNSIIKKYLWSKFRRFHKCGKFAFRRYMILSSYTLFFCLCHIQSFVSIKILFKCCLKTIHMKSIGSIGSKSIVCVDSITSYDNMLQFIMNVPSVEVVLQTPTSCSSEYIVSQCSTSTTILSVILIVCAFFKA